MLLNIAQQTRHSSFPHISTAASTTHRPRCFPFWQSWHSCSSLCCCHDLRCYSLEYKLCPVQRHRRLDSVTCDATECDSTLDAGTQEQCGGLAHRPPSYQPPPTLSSATDGDSDQSETTGKITLAEDKCNFTYQSKTERTLYWITLHNGSTCKAQLNTNGKNWTAHANIPNLAEKWSASTNSTATFIQKLRHRWIRDIPICYRNDSINDCLMCLAYLLSSQAVPAWKSTVLRCYTKLCTSAKH